MPAATPPPVTLLYGNQPYVVDKDARRLVDEALGEGPRDFSFQRFDAAELVRPGAGEAAGEGIGAFQLACESTPFLCERWVVRLDHLEAVRMSDRAAQNLLRALGELRLFRSSLVGEPAWALEEDLLPSDPREGGAREQPWVSEVESRAEGAPRLHLAPEAAGARCLLSRGGNRRLVDVPTFLREKLRGKFVLADEEPREPGALEPAPAAAARLHQVLERLLERPPEGLVLILTAVASREGDLSRPLLKKIGEKGKVGKFVVYDDHVPSRWVQDEAAARGVRLSRPLAELLIHLVGNDQGRLAGELDKLALLFGGGRPPEEEELVRAVSGSSGASLFLVTERLGAKDLAGALEVLEHFLAETPGEHPVLIGILARHLRQLRHLHALMRQGVSQSEWPAQLKLHPFIAKKLAAQARRFNEEELERMVQALAGLDLAVKRHAHLTGPLLREFVQGVCRDGFRHPERLLGIGLGDPRRW
jgi:DNA polymerase-3 subunit delta